MKRLRNSWLAFGALLLIISCKTYTIPVESFRKQMMKESSENMKKVKVNNSLFYSEIEYSSNNILTTHRSPKNRV